VHGPSSARALRLAPTSALPWWAFDNLPDIRNRLSSLPAQPRLRRRRLERFLAAAASTPLRDDSIMARARCSRARNVSARHRALPGPLDAAVRVDAGGQGEFSRTSFVSVRFAGVGGTHEATVCTIFSSSASTAAVTLGCATLRT